MVIKKRKQNIEIIHLQVVFLSLKSVGTVFFDTMILLQVITESFILVLKYL